MIIDIIERIPAWDLCIQTCLECPVAGDGGWVSVYLCERVLSPRGEHTLERDKWGE